MKITKLPNSKNWTDDWFNEELNKFNKLIEEILVGCYIDSPKGKTEGKLECENELFGKLKFFYYRDNTYRNAIWIKVHNPNGLKIWIRIGIYNTGKKKVNVYSANDLDIDCINLGYVENYSLPPNFDINGIWISDKGRRASNITLNDVLQQICKLLPCLSCAKSVNRNYENKI